MPLARLLVFLCISGTAVAQIPPQATLTLKAGDALPGLLELTLKPEAMRRVETDRGHGRLQVADRLTTGLASLDALNRQQGVRAIHLPAVDPRDTVERPRLICLLEVPADADPEQLARAYRRNPHVAYAEPVIAYQVVATPNDLEFPDQWPHDSNHMDSEAAWDLTTGHPDVPIAFIDTGLDWTHQDLKDNLWINSAEDANGNGQFDNSPYPGGDLNGVDDDGNGKVDDVIGWDFWGNDPDPQHLSGDHGTKTAGVAVAATNNVWGVAGIAGGWGSQPGCPVMVLRAGSGTFLSSYYIWQAIDYARINGAKVINMSFVGSYHTTIERAVQDAWDAGLVMAAGAGSSSTNALKYPAAHPQVLAVNGTQLDDTKQAGSPWGMVVDVSAPGDNIWTTVPGGGYVSSPGGTPSLATAHVSGLAGLIFSYLGVNTPADRVYATLKYSTEYITGAPSSTNDHWGFVGSGRINSHNALVLAQNTLVVPDQYATIAAAVSAATAGQTVFIRPGTYNEDVSLKSDVAVIGARADITTINGTVWISGDANAQLAGVTVDDYIGVYISNSPNVIVRNCRIVNGSWGFLIYGSSPILRHNEITANNTGIYLGSGAGTSADIQNSRIDGNSKGIYARSTPMLYNKHNSIKNNTTYDLQATSTSGTILALRNWWGEDPPDPSQINTVNNIYYFSHLTADPIPADHTPAKTVGRRPDKPDQHVPDRPEIIELYATGRQLMDEGHPQAAGKIFLEVLNQYPDSRLAPVALKELVGLYARQDEAREARRLLRATAKKAATAALSHAVGRLEFDLLILEGRYADALALAASAEQLAADQEWTEELAFEAARLQQIDLDRKTAGTRALRAYLNRFPAQSDQKDRQVRRQVAHALLDEPAEAEPTAAAKQAADDPAAMLAVEGANPFNPETTVSFRLDSPTMVALQVYNVAGQRVRRLIDGEHYVSGRHRIRWDGTNDQGHPLASGVYLMRLDTEARTDVRKLTLVR